MRHEALVSLGVVRRIWAVPDAPHCAGQLCCRCPSPDEIWLQMTNEARVLSWGLPRSQQPVPSCPSERASVSVPK